MKLIDEMIEKYSQRTYEDGKFDDWTANYSEFIQDLQELKQSMQEQPVHEETGHILEENIKQEKIGITIEQDLDLVDKIGEEIKNSSYELKVNGENLIFLGKQVMIELFNKIIKQAILKHLPQAKEDLKSLQDTTEEIEEVISVKIKGNYCPVCGEDSSFHNERAYVCEKCYGTDEHKELIQSIT